MSKVLVVGLDALDPSLVNSWLSELPNLRRLMEAGISGPLHSIVQPVTPAAWTAMISGRNQGHFGFTDFFYRPGPGYGPLQLVHSGAIRSPTIRHFLAAAGMRSIMIGVPVSYPPLAMPNSICVSCFMAPQLSRGITNPVELQAELLAATSQPYLLDVAVEKGAQTNPDELAARLIEFDRQRFDVALHLMRTRPWELLFLVCMGTDRVGHYFMRYQDPAHRCYPGRTRHSEVMFRHYRYCDRRLGELIEEAGPDTTVLVVSDHGMQRLDGRVHLNRWLIEQGYLRLTKQPDDLLTLHPAHVDWRQTRAWAMGYGGQIYLNLKGREQNGCVPADRVGKLCHEIAAGLSQLSNPEGETLPVTAYFGRDLFDGQYAAYCPDLCVQFDALRYLTSNRVDQGPLVTPVAAEDWDDGSHARQGFFAMAGPNVPPLGRFSVLHLLDVAPTILDLLGLPLPELEGQPVHQSPDDTAPYDEADGLALTNRLQKLYLD